MKVEVHTQWRGGTRQILRRLVKTVSAWREEARAARIPKRALEAYASAFETDRLCIAARECKA